MLCLPSPLSCRATSAPTPRTSPTSAVSVGKAFTRSTGSSSTTAPSTTVKMSFATLQEHLKHVHEAHCREYHSCPTCSKVFSAPSLLERHIVTHVGGKPFACEVCDKAYQIPSCSAACCAPWPSTPWGPCRAMSPDSISHRQRAHSPVSFVGHASLCRVSWRGTSALSIQGSLLPSHCGQIVQVTQTSEQGAAEHIISFDDAKPVTLPESQ